MPRYHRHYGHNHQADNGLMLMLIGALVGSPFIFWFGFLQYATAPMSIAATGVAGGTLFSVATLGIGALILYGSIGLAYLYSGARECYNTDKGPFDLLKSRITNEDSWSFKGIISLIGTVLWAPFLFIGGVTGMTVKAIVNTLPGSKLSSPTECSGNDFTKNPLDPLLSSSDLQNIHSTTAKPIHSDPLFSEPPSLDDIENHEDIDQENNYSTSRQTY